MKKERSSIPREQENNWGNHFPNDQHELHVSTQTFLAGGILFQPRSNESVMSQNLLIFQTPAFSNHLHCLFLGLICPFLLTLVLPVQNFALRFWMQGFYKREIEEVTK